jgi:uncharacterized phiE125 gp8 family phage protein
VIGRLRVVTPPASEAITLAEAKAHLRVTSGSEDAIIARHIRAAREYAEHLTQRAIGVQALELRLPSFPAGGGPIELARPPVISITSIEYRDADGVAQTLTSATYEVRNSEAGARVVVATPGASWPETDPLDGEVVVTYAAGYTAQTLPASTASFMLLEVGTLYANRESTAEKPVAANPFAERLLDRSRVWDI